MRCPGLAWTAILLATSTLSGCGWVGALRADREIQTAHTHYNWGRHALAAESYEEVIRLDPERGEAYFFLGSSYHRLFRERARTPDTERYLTLAARHYRAAIERLDDEEQVIQAWRYLAEIHGPEGLDDRGEEEAALTAVVALTPDDPQPGFSLVEFQVRAGHGEAATRELERLSALDAADGHVHSRIAGLYDQLGRFDESIDALRRRAALMEDSAEARYVIAAFYWRQVSENIELTDAERADHLRQGLAALDEALELDADYADALTYKEIQLSRLAELVDDPSERRALLEQAKEAGEQAATLNASRDESPAAPGAR
mgnify:CR=1 FL=1